MKRIALLVTAVFFAACLFGTAMAADPSRDDTLIVANIADTNGLDPIMTSANPASNIFIQIYDYLFFQNPDGSLSPRLVEKWEQPDELTYIFHIKQGVKFHNGDPLTADDVKFTIDRARTTATSAGTNVLLDMIADVKKIDDHTVSVHLKSPFTPFLYVFTEMWGGVVNKKVIEDIGTDAHNRNPIGSGPYKFTSWTRGDRVVLDRNDDYHGKKPAFQRVIVRAVPEDSVRTIELESGAIDAAYQVSVNDFKRIEANSKLTLKRMNALRVHYMAFNCSRAPFDNPLVRRGIAKALDVTGIQRAAFRGTAYPLAGPLPRDMRYSDLSLEVPKRDVEEAKRLLAEAGVKDLKFTIITDDQKVRVDAATIIQAQLEEIGVKVDIQVLEIGAQIDKEDNGDYDVTMDGWGNNLPDAEFALSRLFHSRAIGSSNFLFYKNEAFDAILDKGAMTPDGPEREAVYKEAQKMFLEELPALYWSVNEVAMAHGPRIAEFPITMRGIYELVNVERAK